MKDMIITGENVYPEVENAIVARKPGAQVNEDQIWPLSSDQCRSGKLHYGIPFPCHQVRCSWRLMQSPTRAELVT